MIRNILVSTLLILIASVITNASDINGKWLGKIQDPDGDRNLIFSFKGVDGDSLTGTSMGPMEEDLEILNSKFDGKNFSFELDIYIMIIHHKCKIVNETIDMVVSEKDAKDERIIVTCLKEEED